MSRRRVAPAILAVLAALGFVALGVWQLERRVWKHALIERVTTRVGAAPVAVPSQQRWAQVDAAGDEYRHVRLAGRWLSGGAARVLAVTRLGPGCWLLAPLRQDGDGSVVYVNRGFLGDAPAPTPAPTPAPPPAPASTPNFTTTATASPCAPDRPPPEPPPGPVVLTGLLRLNEPGGGFLRRNDPASDRWFSRDVTAIATARRLGPVAPFFVDADAAASSTVASAGPAEPVGGLTVVAFRDDHLVYAATWFGLAAIAGFGARRFAGRSARPG